MSNATMGPGRAKAGGSILSGLAWQYAAVALQAASQFAVLAVLSRLLTADEFGVVGAATVFTGFAALFSQMGVAPAIVQRADLTSQHISSGATVSVLLGVLTAAVIWIAAPMIGWFFTSSIVVPVVRVISCTFLFASIGSVSDALLQREMRFRELMLVNVGSYVLGYGAVGIVLGFAGAGVWALVAATLAQNLLRSIMLLSRYPVRFTPLISVRAVSELFRFGGGFTLAQVLNYGATQGDYVVVGRTLGTQQLGMYMRAYQLMMLPATYLGQVVERVMFPAMSRVQNDQRRLEGLFLQSTALVCLVVAPIGMLMFICAREIVEVLLGAQWGDVVAPFRVLAVGVMFRTAYKLGDALAKACGAVYRRSVREGLYMVLVVGGSWIGVRWGLVAVASFVLMAVFVNYLTAARLGLRIVGSTWRRYGKTHFGGLVMSVIAGLTAYGMRSFSVSMGMPALLTLSLASIAAVLTSATALLTWPAFFGVDIHEALKTLVRRLPQRRMPAGINLLVKRIGV